MTVCVVLHGGSIERRSLIDCCSDSIMSSGRGLSFVSETDLEEKRKKRQEEWEKVRQPDEPLECPEEEPFDGRTLYERLQEQKDKKQEEWEEQHKFKNMIRGLDNDETDFLGLVAKQQAAIDKTRYDQECKEISEYRTAVSQLPSSAPVGRKPTSTSAQQPPGKKSQLALIAGAIKRKSTSDKEDSSVKKSKSENADVSSLRTAELKTDSEANTTTELVRVGQAMQPHCREQPGPEKHVTGSALIPGVGAYSSSSDSNSDSSDSEIEVPLTTPRLYREAYM